MRFIVRNKTLLTYGLTLVNLVAIVLFSLLATTDRIHEYELSDNLFQTIDVMDQMTTELTLSEADVHNFILTSEGTYVDRYRNHRKPLEDRLKSLEGLLNKSPDQKKKFHKLKALVNRQIFNLESSIQLKKNNGLLHASEFLQARNKDKCMDQIRMLQSDLIEEQKGIIMAGQKKLEFSRKSREYIIISASIGSLLISIIAIGTIVTDLNEKKERERYLEEVNQNKDKFFTLISHDLKGPAHNLIGLSEILMNDKSLTEEEKNSFLEHLNTTAKKNYSLLENLLEWSRIQMGTVQLFPQLTDFSLILQETLILLDEKAFEKKISIKNEIPSNTEVYADANSIKTVLRNLISNALKFTPKGGVVSIKIYDKSSTFLKVVVEDSGVGMDQKTKENLFNPGKVVSRYGTDGETGSGIGLLLCKEFIDKNKGKIWVESEPGRGTSFYFSLPVSIADNKGSWYTFN